MQKIKEILYSNGIFCFYHITKYVNWDSGKSTDIKNIGLYSREYLQDKNIIPSYLTNELSHSLDSRSELNDYVRLSFTLNNPCLNSFVNRTFDAVAVLKVDFSVLDESEFMLSNINATDNNAKYFSAPDDILKYICFDAFKEKENIPHGSKYYKTSQAEVMIKTHIKPKFIKFVEKR